jgi:hypothetical protein
MGLPLEISKIITMSRMVEKCLARGNLLNSKFYAN